MLLIVLAIHVNNPNITLNTLCGFVQKERFTATTPAKDYMILPGYGVTQSVCSIHVVDWFWFAALNSNPFLNNRTQTFYAG